MELTREGREIVFVWVPGHVSIRENSAADLSLAEPATSTTCSFVATKVLIITKVLSRQIFVSTNNFVATKLLS